MYNSLMLSDTNPKIEETYFEMVRQQPAWRKLEQVAQLNETVKQLNLAGLRSRFPQESKEKLRRRLADLWLGEILAEKAYGPLEE